jgi:hypothetical protein
MGLSYSVLFFEPFTIQFIMLGKTGFYLHAIVDVVE